MRKALVIGLAVLLLLINIANSAAPSTTFPKETKFFDRLAPGDEQFVVINSPEILFTKVGVTTNTNVTRARVVVQAMPDCPENAPYQTDVLQCFVVTTQNFGDIQIASADISFKVPKEWILSNGYSKNAVVLRRYSYSWNEGAKLSEWKDLMTTLEDEDDAYYHYKASSDGFSYFSIVGGKKEQAVSNDAIMNDDIISDVPTQQMTAMEEKPEQITIPVTPTKKSTSNPIWIFVAVLAAISIAISFVLHKREVVVENDDKIDELEPLVEYIGLMSDYPEEDIRNTLTDAGWKDWQIELAFNQIKLKP